MDNSLDMVETCHKWHMFPFTSLISPTIVHGTAYKEKLGWGSGESMHVYLKGIGGLTEK